MKSTVGHRWTIGAATLILVLALGTVAWAATEDSTTDPVSEEALPAPGYGMFGPGECAPPGGPTGFGMMGGRGLRGGEITEEMKAQIEERRAAMEERREAFLDLVREQMSSEDRAALDSLLAQQESQREALDAAREALRGTSDQIHDLIGEYFPVDDPSTSDGGI